MERKSDNESKKQEKISQENNNHDMIYAGSNKNEKDNDLKDKNTNPSMDHISEKAPSSNISSNQKRNNMLNKSPNTNAITKDLTNYSIKNEYNKNSERNILKSNKEAQNQNPYPVEAQNVMY